MKHLCTLLLLLLMAGPVMGALQDGQVDEIRIIRVGAVLPLDGQWAGIGTQCETALTFAQDTVNEYLRPHNLGIELVIRNSGSDPGQDRSAR